MTPPPIAPAVLALWITETVLLWSLLGLLIVRRAWREYTAFFACICFCAADKLVLIPVRIFRLALYPALFGPKEIIGNGLCMLVGASLFVKAFCPLWMIPDKAWVRFCAGAAIPLALLLGWYWSSSKIGTDLELFSEFLSFIFFASIAMMSSQLGLYWRARRFGIGLGFLINLSSEAVRSVLVKQFPQHLYRLDYLLILSYMTALGVWTWHFWRPETKTFAQQEILDALAAQEGEKGNEEIRESYR